MLTRCRADQEPDLDARRVNAVVRRTGPFPSVSRANLAVCPSKVPTREDT